jgi:hypothetical protein
VTDHVGSAHPRRVQNSQGIVDQAGQGIGRPAPRPSLRGIPTLVRHQDPQADGRQVPAHQVEGGAVLGEAVQAQHGTTGAGTIIDHW